MNVSVRLLIEKPIAEVWEVMGKQFGHAHRWSSNFKSSKPCGESKFPGLEYSGRDTITDRGNTIQELTAFDPSTHSLTYQITKGAPEIAQQAGASWSLVEANDQTTQLVMQFILEPKMQLPPEMEAKIKMGLSASVNQLAGELKYFLEKGKPHPAIQH